MRKSSLFAHKKLSMFVSICHGCGKAIFVINLLLGVGFYGSALSGLWDSRQSKAKEYITTYPGV
jgi:hypothetical protein